MKIKNVSHHLMALSALILAALALHPIGFAAATSVTPAYVLGVSSPLDPLVTDLQGLTSSVTILPSVSSLSLLGSGSILYVDGAWLSTVTSLDPTILSIISNTALRGVPTVVVRGSPGILADSIQGLIGFHDPGLPLIAEGVKILGTLADGTQQAATLQVLAGFDYSVAAEFHWAEQLLTQTPTTIAPAQSTLKTNSGTRTSSGITTSATTSPPFWSFIIRGSTDTGDFFAPVGRVVSTFTVFLLQNSGSTAYKWFNFFWNSTIQPGTQIYNSPWRTALEQDSARVDPSSNQIVSHGPIGQITQGPSTVTYSIGTEAGSLGANVTASQTQSYFIKNTNVTDASSDSTVGWVHSVNSRTSSGTLTFQIIPGWTDRVLQSKSVYITGSFTTTFVTLNGSSVASSNSTSVQFFAQGG
jgi:hypothetical protein